MEFAQIDYMLMEALADLNKVPANLERSQLDDMINSWTEYSKLVSWASSELQVVASTEESVQPIKSMEDLPNFQMEFSGLLKELGCPYTLMDQPASSRFDCMEKRKVVLNYLLSELQAGRILHVNTAKGKQLRVELDESGTAKILREIVMELGLGKPPDSITPTALWNNISGKMGALLKTTGVLDPLFDGHLSEAQWNQIDKYFSELTSDYEKRREMLLKRLDVTVQSFHWSDRMKGKKEKEINDKFEQFRGNLKSKPSVNVADVLAARGDLPIVEKTASASVRKNTKSAVNNVVIGRVPDRGGRTDEIQPPPPEMPPWQQRQGGAPAGSHGWIQQGAQQPRGGGRGGGGRGGGRVQGGWSDGGRGGGGRGGGGGYQQHNDSRGGGGYQHNDNRGGGGYQQDNRGGYQQQQYDNRGGYQQQQYDSRGGYQQQQYDNQGSSGYQQSQGGYYQHDNRGGGGGGYQQNDKYDDNRRGRGGGHRGGGDRRRY